MRKKYSYCVIGILVIALFVLIGCAPAKRPAPRTVPTPNQTKVLPRTTTPQRTRVVVPKSVAPVPNPVPNPSPTAPNMVTDAKVRAQRISNELTKMKEIQGATVVVSGNNAVVGLQFDKQYKGTMTTRIKEMVNNRVKKVDTAIKNVAVTADPDIYSRIKGIASGIESGKPLSGFVKQIEEIMNRINPK